jgi:hypothetical protein
MDQSEKIAILQSMWGSIQTYPICLHTCIKPLLASRCGVFQNVPPVDGHAFLGTFHLKPLNLVNVLITSY